MVNVDEKAIVSLLIKIKGHPTEKRVYQKRIRQSWTSSYTLKTIQDAANKSNDK